MISYIDRSGAKKRRFSESDYQERFKVAYLTTFYNGAVDGRFGRFHDWIHALRDLDDPPFEFEVVALSAVNPDETLSSRPPSYIGNGDELWGTPCNKPEFMLNVPRTVRDLWRIDFDVLHVLTMDTIAYMVATLFRSEPLVVGPDVQGYFPGRRGNRWSKPGLEWYLQRSRFKLRQGLQRLAPNARVVTLSEYHRSNVEALGFDEASIDVIPPGVDSIFSPGESSLSNGGDRPFDLLYVGDLSTYKGYTLFLRSLAELPAEVDWEATIVGAGNPSQDLPARLGIDDRVTHEGFVSRTELPEYYHRADLFVMPSVDENGPNTVIESLSCGTPVLATDRPGINEYGDESCCLFFERTRAGLREAIKTGINRLDSLRRGAVMYSRSHSIKDTIEGLEQTYRKAIKPL